MVTYSNEIKENVLRIPYFIIAQNGAVSKEVASLMARNVRIIAKTDFGIGITGIAGPTGGTIRKPVGTVFISIDSHKGQICNKFLLKGNRSAIRKTAALKSLELLKPLI
jgi:nicotinamide-nucleotide amidase